TGSLPRDGGLYDAVQRAGEGRPLGGLVCDVLAYDLDLPAAGRAGDRFKVVVDKVYRDGQLYRYGAIQAVQWEGAAGTIRAVRHARAGQAPAYYSPEGEDLVRTWLRSPLRLGRPLGRPVLHHDGRKLLG